MCGRYVITTPPEAMQAFLGLAEPFVLPPRYNIAPTQPIPIVRFAQGRRQLALVRWGLVPSWVKDPRQFSLLINARAESVLDKPAFRAAMRRRRCLIPADGFYEWKGEVGAKRPYFIRRRDGGPMAFAGLWEVWTGPNGEEVETVAIVTTDANRTLRPLHDRMPVMLAPEAFDLWLDDAHVDAQTAAALLVPAAENLLEAYEVSTAVNRAANDGPALIAPLACEAADAAAAPVQTGRPKSAARRKPSRGNGQASLF